MQQANRRKVGILLIIIGLLIAILFVYFAFLRRPVTTGPGETPGGQTPSGEELSTTTPGDQPRNYQRYNISQEAPHQTNASDLAKLAMAFSERFGSYSNQSDYGNFTDLKIFMTKSLQEWADNYVAGLKEQAKDPSEYFGLSTKAITAETKNFDDQAGTAQVTVSTQRRESSVSPEEERTYMQDIDVYFLKSGGQWLVDRVYWEKL